MSTPSAIEGFSDNKPPHKINIPRRVVGNQQEGNLTFIMILPLTVGCVNLSLQNKNDKALRYCIDRSSFCHDLKMKILIILLNNCHSISSL
jgi:hypothetical protein